MKQQEHPTIEFRGMRQRPRSPLRKVGKVLLILAVILGVLVGGTALYLKSYVSGKINDTHDSTITAIDPLPPGQAYNILVLGSDRRDVVEASQRNERQFRGGGGRRADTILVIHVPADQKSATILSFPRDLRVKIPGTSGYSKINAAYGGSKGVTGPNLMIKTIKSLTGLRIHHYVEVNFSSFQRIVDAVGGVELCPQRTYNEPQSGLVVRKAGCQEFNGKMALAYVRMRKQDPRGDFGRIDRQQEFIRQLMGKVKSIGFLLDIPRLVRTVNAVSKGVVTDQNLGEGELRGIANKLAGFKQSNVDFRVVPSSPKYIGSVAYVVERTAQARAVYKALATDGPLPEYGKTGASIPSPAEVTAQVLNGTTTNGLASTVRDRLRRIGFKITATGNAPRRDYATTVIIFQPGDEAKATLIAEEFPGATVQEGPASQDTDIVIILGADEASRASPSPG